MFRPNQLMICIFPIFFGKWFIFLISACSRKETNHIASEWTLPPSLGSSYRDLPPSQLISVGVKRAIFSRGTLSLQYAHTRLAHGKSDDAKWTIVTSSTNIRTSNDSPRRKDFARKTFFVIFWKDKKVTDGGGGEIQRMLSIWQGDWRNFFNAKILRGNFL